MKKLVLTLAAIGFAVAPALAQEADFTKVDANADGQVSLQEATTAGWTWTEDQFKQADADASGGLSSEEFKAVAG